MNPETTLSREQIIKLFAHNHIDIGSGPTINRITIGFTNEVHEVNGYILKVCIRPNWEAYFQKEAGFYKELYGKVLVPKIVVADDSKKLLKQSYMIYEKIAGNPLGGRWHIFSNAQRKEIIRNICEQMKSIQASEPNPQLSPKGATWQGKICEEIEKYLKIVETKELLPLNTVHSIREFIAQFKEVLKPQTLGLMYWDIHLDNIIVDLDAKVVGIVDFEHVDVVSLDFVLILVRNIMNYPQIMLSAEEEKYAKKEDYKYLRQWYEEFYPELFAFDNLERRIDFYDLADVLRMLPRFPKAAQLHERINKILSKPASIH